MENKNGRTWDAEITELCPILYCMRGAPMSETCMCWGFECGEGWKEPLKKLSCQLETMNLYYYSKYRVRIQADQVKEKFGTLRFYFSIMHDPCGFLVWIRNKLKKCARRIAGLDFKLAPVVDEPARVETRVEEVTKTEFNKAKKDEFHRPVNVSYSSENGKYFKTTKLEHCERRHYVPTRHKIMHKFMKWLESLSWKMQPAKMSSEQEVVCETLHTIADLLVAKTEQECACVCEDCGRSFYDSNPRCGTAGWITYVCEDCARKKDSKYYKNGKLWYNGSEVKEKKQPKKSKGKTK